MTDTIRVLIADDQTLFRQAIRTVLQASADIELVAEASDGNQAVDLATEHSPDVVLMDLKMPTLSGIDATKGIKEALPATQVVMLTVSDDSDDLFEAIKAGASGYLLKDIDPDEIAKAVKAIHHGHSMLSPVMASKLLGEFTSMSKQSDRRLTIPSLTDQQTKVLKLAAQGLTNRAIGKELFIAENTVKNHIRNILDKLHLSSRLEAVMFAVREKLIDLE